jgi:low temperature requirement protein LtrA
VTRSRIEPDEEVRVSTVELFFDLVFVFTITQLTSVLIAEPDWVGVAKALLIFGNVWWMYGGYAWLTNAVPPREPALRLLIFVGMAAFLVVALSIPDAFGDSGVAFGVAYLVVNLVHTGMFLKSNQESALRSMAKLGPFNMITALILLAAGFADGPWQWALWIVAFVGHWVTPYLTAVEGFRLRPGHFVERHGLIVLIALGESIVAVGIGVQGHALEGGLVLTSVLGLGVAAALWWLYFDGEDERAERALTAAPPERVTWLCLYAFGFAFVPILFGIVLLAAGVKEAIVHYGEPASTATAWFMASGVALYVAGLCQFRVVLRTGPIKVRLALAVLALGTALVGLTASPEAQLATLLVIAVAAIVVERRTEPVPA